MGVTATPQHESLFWRYGKAIALRRGNRKLVRQPAGPAAPPGPFELYNLADVAEKRNLAAAESALAAELRAGLDRLKAGPSDAYQTMVLSYAGDGRALDATGENPHVPDDQVAASAGAALV